MKLRRPDCHRWLCIASSLFGLSGCALTAQPAPTPARDPNLSVTTVAPPGVRYYLMVFGSERTPRQPRYTHTWATIAKVTEGPTEPSIEVATISWMPETLRILPWRFRVEPGTNLGLHETLEYVLENKERVVMYGPYEVRPELYHRFLIQRDFLESHVVGYQCLDTVGQARDGSGCACIHGVTDMDPDFSRGNYPLLLYGTDGSQHIVRELFKRGLVVCREKHMWLVDALCLKCYPIRYRTHHGRLGQYQNDRNCGGAPCQSH